MRLTTFTDFALRALMRLAGEPSRSFATGEIAAEFGISRNHLAKVVRDRLMAGVGAAFPAYGFERHMGYGTREHGAALHLGARDLGTGQLESLLDIPDDIGLQLVAVILIKGLETGGEGECAKNLETFMRLAEIRMGFLDDDPGSLELERRLLDDRRDLSIDRRDAEIAAEGDAFRFRP